ncbi:MAG: hypothetical protein ACLR8Y_05365 [Alistipes indistinctus]
MVRRQRADNGLIDAWGGLSDAISLAADRAGVGDDFSISVPSQAPDLFTSLRCFRPGRRGSLQNGLGELYRSMPDYRRSFHGRSAGRNAYRLEIR